MRKLSATVAREGGAKAPARNGMTTGLEGHRSAPSRRRTRRPDNGRGEGAAPGDGATAAIGAAMDAAVNAATASVTVTETGTAVAAAGEVLAALRSEEHTSELQSRMRSSNAVV